MPFVHRVKAMGGAHTEMNFERQEDISIDGIVDHCLRYVGFKLTVTRAVVCVL